MLKVVFGVQVEKESLPWHDDSWLGDIEKWWESVNGFQPTFFPYTEEGGYKPGISADSPEIRAYYDERRDFLAQCPCPAGSMPSAGVDYESEQEIVYIETSRQFYDWEAARLSCIEGKKIAFESSHDTSAFCDFVKKYIREDVTPTWWVVPHYG